MSGAQQLRDQTRRYRHSNHDTSIFFLQSERGVEKYAVSDSKVDRLRAAFRPMHARSHLVGTVTSSEKKKKRKCDDN